MFLFHLFLLPLCFGQFVLPFIYDPTGMAADMNYMNQQIMAQNKAIQRQILLQNKARMQAIPADGKVHSYVDRIPGGESREASYHSKDQNGEEYAESHFTSQSFGQGNLAKEGAPQLSLGLESAYANYLQNKMIASAYGFPAFGYELVPTFYKPAVAKYSESVPVYPTIGEKLPEYSSKYKVSPTPQTVDVFPIAAEVVVPQIHLSSSVDVPKNPASVQDSSGGPSYATRVKGDQLLSQ